MMLTGERGWLCIRIKHSGYSLWAVKVNENLFNQYFKQWLHLLVIVILATRFDI